MEKIAAARKQIDVSPLDLGAEARYQVAAAGLEVARIKAEGAGR
jgi:hypothetical protein